MHDHTKKDHPCDGLVTASIHYTGDCAHCLLSALESMVGYYAECLKPDVSKEQFTELMCLIAQNMYSNPPKGVLELKKLIDFKAKEAKICNSETPTNEKAN